MLLQPADNANCIYHQVALLEGSKIRVVRDTVRSQMILLRQKERKVLLAV